MKNTKSQGEYIFDHVIYGLLVMIIYRNVLFRSLPELSFSESKFVLWGMYVGLLSLCAALSMKNYRNNISLVSNIILPLELYTLIAYWNTAKSAWIWILTVGLLLSMGWFVLVVVTGFKENRKRIYRYLIHGFVGARSIAVCSIVLMLAPVALNTVMGNAVVQSNVAPVSGNTEEKVKIDDNIDVVGNLRETVWHGLSTKQKLDTLQVIANIQSCYLGLPYSLTVGTEPMEEETCAYYSDDTKEIRISIDYLETAAPRDICETVCHESHHAYAHRIIEAYDSVDEEYRGLLIFQYAPEYKENFANYIDGEDDYLAYYLQAVELHARQYAAEAVEDYYSRIEQYFGTAEKGVFNEQ